MVSDEEMTGRHVCGSDRLMAGEGGPFLNWAAQLVLFQRRHTGFVPACVPKRMTPAVHLLFEGWFSCRERDMMRESILRQWRVIVHCQEMTAQDRQCLCGNP